MAGIFISYRREDTAADAGRLYDDLRRRHTSEVFLDLSMRAGVDFHEALFAKVESCDVLLALIGPRWLQARNEVTSERRLEEESDYVRQEIQAALAMRKTVIPVLLPGARMPTAEELPAPIRDLARRNAFAFHYERWSTDMDELVAQLPGRVRHDEQAISSRRWQEPAYAVCTAVGVLVALHVFSVYNLPFDAHYVAAGASLLLGLAASQQFRLSTFQKLGVALSIAALAAILSSIVIPLLSGQNMIPSDLVEVRLIVTFMAIVFVSYVVGIHVTGLYRYGEEALRKRATGD